ncbi:GNAT family N-acetyltransferase [Mesobacillus boroniphilus]|uniref:GNAT family N-acetyltransferase n=1 Tax=Mesobacillus boroniphilus TaxID=308892 RepID=A0A944CNK2_9BACI|nr:GNAT family N-acetyltransferase [Mesobacillus boroniphilus]MBS8265895.1 GNAT family N-acetyltransferase [Mesobacillus boroniphilus]
MTIRRATQAEANYIVQLSGKVMKESSMGYAENSVQNAYNLFMPIIQSGGYFLIDEENRRLKGWILLATELNMVKNQVIGNLLSVYVFPKYRKSGIGKDLTAAAIQEFKGQGIRTIQLNVFEGNPSRILCENLGFKPISTVMELDI